MAPQVQERLSHARVAVRWALAAAVAVLIFYLSSRTGGQLGEGFAAQVKAAMNAFAFEVFGIGGDPMSSVAHFCEYALLGFLLANALRSHMSVGRACVLAIVCASAYGVTDEVHQIFVDGRYCDVVDWVVDTCGAALGSLVCFLALRHRPH